VPSLVEIEGDKLLTGLDSKMKSLSKSLSTDVLAAKIKPHNAMSLGPQVCNFSTHSILMKGITWSRDSHGLFDYESRHLTKRTLKAEKQMILVRAGNELQLLPYNPEEPLR